MQDNGLQQSSSAMADERILYKSESNRICRGIKDCLYVIVIIYYGTLQRRNKIAEAPAHKCILLCIYIFYMNPSEATV